MRRRATWAFCLAVLLVCARPAAAGQPGPAPATPTARAAVLYDPGTSAFVVSRNGSAHLPVASLVKLMTVRLAVEAGDAGGTVVVPQAVTDLPETKAGLVPGQRVSMQTLVEAMLVRSANDAALTAAVALAGSEPAFADRMNSAAATLGLNDTHYVDSTGLDAPGQYSSAQDVARLAAADLRLPSVAAVAVRRSVVIPGGATYRTVNPFLAEYAGATGLKTGFTSTAMFCLAASAERGGHSLLAVVLGEPSWGAADADAAALLNWEFALEGSGTSGARLPVPATTDVGDAAPGSSAAVPAPPPAAAALAAPEGRPATVGAAVAAPPVRAPAAASAIVPVNRRHAAAVVAASRAAPAFAAAAVRTGGAVRLLAAAALALAVGSWRLWSRRHR